MYLGAPQISKLYDHVQGYRMDCMLNKSSRGTDDQFFDGFNEFVYDYYEVETYGNWKDIILEQSFDNELWALDNFFELLDLFYSDARTVPVKKIVITFFEQVIDGKDLANRLGNAFESVKQETLNLVKDNLWTNRKSDYDYVLEQLELKAEAIPELGLILATITDTCKTH